MGQSEIFLLTETGEENELSVKSPLKLTHNDGDQAAYALLQTTDGGFAMVGWTEVEDGEWDMWLVKTDSNGIAQWNHTYGGIGYEYAEDLLQTEDGGYVLVGIILSFHLTHRDTTCLIKTDTNGIPEWNHTLGENDYSWGSRVIQTTDGGFSIAGNTQGPTFSGDKDMWLIKTNATGGIQWESAYGGTGSESAQALLQISEGGYVLAGYTTSYGIGESDMWLVKTDDNGIAQWNHTYGGIGREYTWGLIQTMDGGHALVGKTNSSGSGGYDTWLVKTDANGKIQWNQTYGKNGEDSGGDLLQTTDGGFALAGYTDSYGLGGFDAWLIKTNSTGNVQWNQTYGGLGDDIAISLVQTPDGGYVLAGYTSSGRRGD